MEARISRVTRGVDDVVRARRFYEALGWRAGGPSNERVTFFRLGGMALSLYGRQALAEDTRQSREGGGFAGSTLGQNLRTRDEVDAHLAEPAAARGTIRIGD